MPFSDTFSDQFDFYADGSGTSTSTSTTVPATANPTVPRSAAVQLALKVPFQIDTGSGQVSTITDPVALAAQEIKTILLTMNGERPFNPLVGSAFNTHVFGALSSADAALQTDLMLEALQNQTTLSTIQSAVFTVNQNDGTMAFNVQFVPIGYFLNQTVTVTLS